jgi:hypothetical protein
MFPVVRSASVGWPFASAPTGQLIVADAGTPLGRTFSPTAMVPLAWEPDGQSDAVVGLTQARRNGPLFLHSRSLSGADRDLVEVAVSPAGRFVARWDAAHARALVAVSDGTTLGTPRWSYWLVRFGEGAS